MRIILLTFLLTLSVIRGFTQVIQDTDSLRHQFTLARQDTSKVLILIQLCLQYRGANPDSAMLYGQRALTLAKQIHYHKGEIRALSNMGFVMLDFGNLPKALQMQFNALQLAEKYKLPGETGRPFNQIGSIYLTLNEYQKALSYYQKARNVFEKSHDYSGYIGVVIAELNLGNVFERMNQLDSASYYAKQAYNKIVQVPKIRQLPLILELLARIEAKKGNKSLALNYYQRSIKAAIINKDHRTGSISYSETAQWYSQQNQPDSCIYYAQKGLEEAKMITYRQGILVNGTLLAKMYQLKNDFKQAFQYQQLMIAAKDSLYGAGNTLAIQQMVADEQQRKREVEQAKEDYQNQLKQYVLLTGLTFLLLVASFLYRNNQKEKKAKAQLQEKNTVIEKALNQLRSTQAQLIQKEKLASLGELTAGIAHEIQNPLNFVNNFSEVSAEMVEEMQQELTKGDVEEAQAIAGDLRQNLQKINHHGKRASSIVKGMLEHSRTGTGERQLTDINQLADEYLRLSYHGLRAKNNDFNSDYELITDKHLPKIEVVPQEIGRVLLNLINNAFYAVNERAKQGETDYQPKVTILTKTNDNQIVIQVQDNGTGIPESVKSKIFQPFFTTKPTGEGTGLGLSLAYDIVTKGHGGTMEVESVEGVETTFIVKLPIQSN
jgi:two-component system NtrC family sensor kinase